MNDTISESKGRLVGWLLVFIILAVVPALTTPYWVTLITQMFIFGILAMSLDLLMGYSGMPSFGHAGFFGAAAYVIAIFATRYHIGFWPSVVTAIVLATAIAAIFGLLVAHSKGVYFLMITLALGMVLWGLAFRWVTMTKGDNGISGIPRPDIGLPISLKDPITFYYVTFVVFIVCLVLMAIFVRSPFGHSMKGIRESESRMRILGYDTWVHRYLMYVVAAFFGSISGVFWAYYNGFVSPADLETRRLLRTFPDGDPGRAGNIDRTGSGCRHHRLPQEFHQRLHRALAPDPGSHLHSHDPLRAAGAREPRERPGQKKRKKR